MSGVLVGHGSGANHPRMSDPALGFRRRIGAREADLTVAERVTLIRVADLAEVEADTDRKAIADVLDASRRGRRT